jgi:tetratricopeptide (TPR) repeat protein
MTFRRALPWLTLCFSLALAPAVGGCNGCLGSTSEKAAKKKKKKKKKEEAPVDTVKLVGAQTPRGAMFSGINILQGEEPQRPLGPELTEVKSQVLSAEPANVTKARAKLDEWIKTHPDDADAHYWRGRSWTAEKLHSKAATDYDKAVTADPTYDWARRWSVVAHIDAIELGAALTQLDALITAHPAEGELYFERGHVHRRMNNTEAALPDLKKACELGRAGACDAVKTIENPPADSLAGRRKSAKAGDVTGGGGEAPAGDAEAPE